MIISFWRGKGIPNIKGRIIDGIARDVAICYEGIPVGLDYLSPNAAILLAYKIISTAYMAKSVEGMIVPEPVEEEAKEE